MVKDIQITFYELTGYLMPGLVIFLALVLLFWAIFFPQPALNLNLNIPELWTALGISYVAGHGGQALGNLIDRTFGRNEDRVLGNQGSLPSGVLTTCRAKLAEKLDIDASTLQPTWIYRLCDDIVIRSGKTGDRDIYVYREGFYRGMCVALFLLGISFFGLAIRIYASTENHLLPISGGKWALRPHHMLFLSILSMLMSWLLYHRYRRFASYRITQAVLGFLSLQVKLPSDKADKKDT